MPLSHTKKLLSLITVIALVMIGLYVILLQRIGHLKQSIVVQEGELALAQAKENQNKEVKKAIDSTLAERDVLEGYYIHPDEIVDFISFIELLAAESGVILEISSVQPHTSSEHTYLETIEFEVVAQGTWRDAYTFLAFIDRMPYQHEVIRSHFEHIEGEQWNLILTFEAGVIKEK